MLVHRRSDVLELPRVELGALLAEDLAQEQAADEVADGEPVGPGDLVEIVRRDEAARPRHVLDDDRRVARDVLAHVPRDRPRVSVEAAARREADNDAHVLALVEGLLGRGRPDHSAEHSDDPEDDDHYLLSYAPLHPSLSLIRRCVSSSWSGRHYTAIIQCGPHSHAGSVAYRLTLCTFVHTIERGVRMGCEESRFEQAQARSAVRRRGRSVWRCPECDHSGRTHERRALHHHRSRFSGPTSDRRPYGP